MLHPDLALLKKLNAWGLIRYSVPANCYVVVDAGCALCVDAGFRVDGLILLKGVLRVRAGKFN